MKVLVAGAAGFIGSGLVEELKEDHEVVALDLEKVETDCVDSFQADLTEYEAINPAFDGVDAAYYLVHSMRETGKFMETERLCAENFRKACTEKKVDQVIYLTGASRENGNSEHLESREMVGEILEEGDYSYTEMRSSIILGEESASYRIIKDVVGKLPVIVTPGYMETPSKPVYIEDVIFYLVKALGYRKFYDRKLDLLGPEELSYRDMLVRYAEATGRKRIFIRAPLPKWFIKYPLNILTSEENSLVNALVESLGQELSEDNPVDRIIERDLTNFTEAVKKLEKERKMAPNQEALTQGK